MKLTTVQWWRVLAIISAIVVFPNLFGTQLGTLEGYFFPVVKNTSIDYVIENKEEQYVDFIGTFDQVRDCEIVDYEWYLALPSGYERLRFFVIIRNLNWVDDKIGKQEYGPRRAFVSKNDLIENVLGISIHRCHSVFYTRSVFWKGKNVK